MASEGLVGKPSLTAPKSAPRLSLAGLRDDVFPALAVLLGVAILLALGVWQVQRLQWKEQLLARIAALQTAPPEPLGVVLHRLPSPGDSGVASRGEVDFVRVQTRCPTLEQTPTLRLYAILNGVMGYRLITACPIVEGPFRSILVDRGFVAREQVSDVRSGARIEAPVVGVLRTAPAASWLSPPNNLAANDWHTRDIPAMAAKLGAKAPPAVFLMLERPRPRGFGPEPAAIPTDIPNNHLGYALTWFGLAIGLAGVYVAKLLGRRRRGA